MAAGECIKISERHLIRLRCIYLRRRQLQSDKVGVLGMGE